MCGRQKSEVALGFLVAAPAPRGGGGAVTLGPAVLSSGWRGLRRWRSQDTGPADVVVVQLLSRVRLFATPWTAARQASLSFTISQSSLKLMCIGSVTPSNHLVLYCPLLLLPSIFPSIRVSGSLPVSWLFPSGGESIGTSASASVLPVTLHD